MVVIVAWIVWFQRNKVAHESLTWDASGILSKVEMLLVEF